jgi:hypothetical protein
MRDSSSATGRGRISIRPLSHLYLARSGEVKVVDRSANGSSARGESIRRCGWRAIR